MREINTQNIALLSFTFDEYGTKGPLAEKYFDNVKNMTPIERCTHPKNIQTNYITYRKLNAGRGGDGLSAGNDGRMSSSSFSQYEVEGMKFAYGPNADVMQWIQSCM